jgi:hypothetical protein
MGLSDLSDISRRSSSAGFDGVGSSLLSLHDLVDDGFVHAALRHQLRAVTMHLGQKRDSFFIDKRHRTEEYFHGPIEVADAPPTVFQLSHPGPGQLSLKLENGSCGIDSRRNS